MSENIETITPKIEQSWKNLLLEDFNTESFISLKSFLKKEKESQVIYPKSEHIFAAFDAAPVSEVKVVILGQDPYHGQGQAHGLCFSVQEGVKSPPSLVNIFKELKSDLNMKISKSGNLNKWARQGVLLLNATLTVRDGQPGSHQKKGWEEFTDQVIRKISDEGDHLVFILWGRFAQAKEDLIDANKHLILKAAHPSPFSAYNGFFGCKHFSKTNEFLEKSGKKAIDWDLNE